MKRGWRHGLIAAGLSAAGIAAAQSPADVQRRYEAAARAASPAFEGFSAPRGEAFFNTAQASDWSCASCHTRDPLTAGRHAATGKPIAPLAPAANPARLTDATKVEKWFKRNCNDVLRRACTPLEMGDVLAYLISLKK